MVDPEVDLAPENLDLADESPYRGLDLGLDLYPDPFLDLSLDHVETVDFDLGTVVDVVVVVVVVYFLHSSGAAVVADTAAADFDLHYLK